LVVSADSGVNSLVVTVDEDEVIDTAMVAVSLETVEDADAALETN